MTSPTLHEIPIQDIQVLGRKRKDLGSLESLIASIKSNGQLTPGLVRPVSKADVIEDDADPLVPWVLVAGERRYRSICLAGIDTYLAINKGDLPPLEQRVAELEENLHRKEMTWDEQAAARAEIHELRVKQAGEEGRGWTLADTARELGETGATISRDIQVHKAIQADPTLKAAGSKKAAVRILDFREHLARQEASLDHARVGQQKLSSLMVEADARDWLRKLPSASASAVISDFPYGGDFHSLGMKRKEGEVSASDYDDTEAVSLDLFVDVVPEIMRITKWEGWMAIFMSETNYPFLRDLFESCCTTHLKYGEITYKREDNGDWTKVMPTRCSGRGDGCNFLRAEVPGWVWYRPNSRNPARFPERHAKNFYENILVVNRGAGRLYKHQDECPNVLVYDAEYGNDRIHSMQKPVAVGRELALRLTLPGELVVDPFFGSGNLLRGAASVQRKIMGSEKNPLMIDQALGNVSQDYGG